MSKLKNWYKKHKNILVAFGFTSLITFLLTLLEINLIISNIKDLEVYAATKEMSTSLKVVGSLGLVNVALLTAWTLMFMFIIFKILFPNKHSFKNALFLNELSFLKNIPSELRKGVDKR